MLHFWDVLTNNQTKIQLYVNGYFFRLDVWKNLQILLFLAQNWRCSFKIVCTRTTQGFQWYLKRFMKNVTNMSQYTTEIPMLNLDDTCTSGCPRNCNWNFDFPFSLFVFLCYDLWPVIFVKYFKNHSHIQLFVMFC